MRRIYLILLIRTASSSLPPVSIIFWNNDHDKNIFRDILEKFDYLDNIVGILVSNHQTNGRAAEYWNMRRSYLTAAFWFKLEVQMGQLKSPLKFKSPVTSLRLTDLPDQSRPLIRHCIAHTLLNHVAETRFGSCLVFWITYTALALFCPLFCILEGSFCLASSEVNGCVFYWPSNFCSLVTAVGCNWSKLSTCKSWTYSSLTTDTESHPVTLDCHCGSTCPISSIDIRLSLGFNTPKSPMVALDVNWWWLSFGNILVVICFGIDFSKMVLVLYFLIYFLSISLALSCFTSLHLFDLVCFNSQTCVDVLLGLVSYNDVKDVTQFDVLPCKLVLRQADHATTDTAHWEIQVGGNTV